MLREDPILKDAFSAALIVAVVLSKTRPGSYTPPTTIRFEGYLDTQRTLIAGRLNEGGDLQNALRMASSFFGAKEHITPLSNFMSSLFAKRNEFQVSESNVALAREVLAKGLIEDGTFIDYLLSPEARRHAQALASNMMNALADSPGFRNGLPLVGERPPIGLLESRKFHEAIRLFDRDVLVAVYLLRISTANIAFTAGKSHLDLSDSTTQALIGPTVATLEALEASVLFDFFKQLPPEKSAAILTRCKALTQSVNICSRDFADQDQILSMLKFFKETAEALTRLEKIQTAQRSTVAAAQKLLDIELPSACKEDADTWISTPLPFALFYSYPLPKPLGAEETTLALDFYPGILKMHTFDQTGSISQWVVDKEGTWRIPEAGYSIPLIPEDLDPDSDEDFTELRRVATNAAFLVFNSLTSAWNRFPTLFSTRFPNTKLVRMSDSNGALTIRISSADKEALLQAVDCKTFSVTQIGDPTSPTDSLTLRIQYAESVVEAAPPETKAEPRIQREIDERFMSQYCQDFRALVSILRRLGVTEDTGRGSHQALCLNAYKYTTSKNFRDGTLTISRRVVSKILQSLHISESDFVRIATGQDRKQPTP